MAVRVGVIGYGKISGIYPDDTLSDLPVGEGTMSWTGLLEVADAAGVEWYIAEQDNPRDALEDVSISLQHLRGLAGG